MTGLAGSMSGLPESERGWTIYGDTPWNSAAAHPGHKSDSIHARAGELHDLGPLLGVGRDRAAVVLRQAGRIPFKCQVHGQLAIVKAATVARALSM
jgi:hypothetical protein